MALPLSSRRPMCWPTTRASEEATRCADLVTYGVPRTSSASTFHHDEQDLPAVTQRMSAHERVAVPSPAWAPRCRDPLQARPCEVLPLSRSVPAVGRASRPVREVETPSGRCPWGPASWSTRDGAGQCIAHAVEFVLGVVVVNGGSDDRVQPARFEVPPCVVGDGDGDVDALVAQLLGDALWVVAVDGECDDAAAAGTLVVHEHAGLGAKSLPEGLGEVGDALLDGIHTELERGGNSDA